MTHSNDMGQLLKYVEQFAPKTNIRCRMLAMYSATIALADEQCLGVIIKRGQEHGLEPLDFNEVVLQSYLFLGFPRMLEAAKHLSIHWPFEVDTAKLAAISVTESEYWFVSGVNLCRQVYGNNYTLLKDKVESFAPEIFRWMIIEGYGKVLSRPGLTASERELAIVASLIVDNRPVQLKSHIRGAINVGTDITIVQQVVEDFRLIAEEGYLEAQHVLDGLNR